MIRNLLWLWEIHLTDRDTIRDKKRTIWNVSFPSLFSGKSKLKNLDVTHLAPPPHWVWPTSCTIGVSTLPWIGKDLGSIPSRARWGPTRWHCFNIAFFYPPNSIFPQTFPCFFGRIFNTSEKAQPNKIILCLGTFFSMFKYACEHPCMINLLLKNINIYRHVIFQHTNVLSFCSDHKISF